MAANINPSSSSSAAASITTTPPPSPWSQVVVMGHQSEHLFSVAQSAPVPDDHSENSDNCNAGVKQAWGKPSIGNGNDDCDDVVVQINPVMDTNSWPALSKLPFKSASPDSISQGSLPTSQGSGVVSLSSSKQLLPNTSIPNSTTNHVTNTHQRSMKHDSTSDAFIQPSSPQPQVPAMETPPGKPGNTTGVSSSHKEGGQKGGGFGTDHQPQRSNSFNRRGGSGQHPRGDGSYHHNHGGRRDQDRGNQDWNHTRYGSGDNHMQQQRGAPRGYPRASHASSFITPQPVHPYPNHMVFPPEVPQPVFYVPSPESLRGVVPIMPQVGAHPMYYPPIPDPQLHLKIMNQIEYYFSNENLVKDTFLRQNMDEQGWVPIKLIAGFKKVMNLTDNILLILNAVQTSTVVEVQNDKIRKRCEWMKWVMPPGPFSPVSSPQARAKSGQDMLAGQFQGVTLDEKSVHGHTEMVKKSLSGEFSSQLQQSGGEGDFRAGSERNTSA